MSELSNVKIGEILSSRNYGDFEIIEDLGIINKKHRINIRFLDTNHIQEVGLYEAKIGNVKDASANKKLIFDPNKIYHSRNYGDFVIIEDEGFIYNDNGDPARKVKIRFLSTGFETSVFYNKVLKREVKDPMLPTIYGIGYAGVNNEPFDEIIYRRWYNMISRCYNPKDKRYNSYGAVGVTVDPRWHNCSNYIMDIKSIYGYDLFVNDPHNYHLDKDYLQSGIPKNMRVYSKDTCIWLNAKSNTNTLTKYNPTNYIGIYEYNGLYYVLVYTQYCNIVEYGPFDSIKHALLLYNSLPRTNIYYLKNLQVIDSCINMRPMCKII